MANINETFKSRGETHGDYYQQCSLAEELKKAIRKHMPNPQFFRPTELHSLDLICTKISRIVTSTKRDPDHWHDIVGYATLIEREINGLDYRTGEKKADD